MRVIFGVLSLLIVATVIGLIAKHQLQAVSGSGVAERMNSAASAAGVSLPPPAPSGGQTARQQAQNIEQQIKDATTQALQQGAHRASDPNE